MSCSPLVVVVVLAVAACSTDRGTIFTLHGTGVAKSFEVILAEPRVAAQVQQRDGEVPFRMNMPQPTEAIAYYRQHDTTKRFPGGVVEGFQIRVEPVDEDANYIPFVLAFDAETGGNVIAIGHFGSVPAAIALPHDRVTRSDIWLEAVALGTTSKLAAGTIYQGACPDSPSEVIGYAWRRATGDRPGMPPPQLRLMVTKSLDLDCDGVEPTSDTTVECNDLTPAYSKDAPESCPTQFDYDCNEEASETMSCSFGGELGNACVGEQRCANPSATCHPSNGDELACACAQGLCNTCILRGEQAMGMLDELMACAPASAKLQSVCPSDGGCTVSVERSPVGWQVGVTSNLSGTIADDATIERNGDLYLYVTASGSSTVAPPGTEFGDILLKVAPIMPVSPFDRPHFRFYRLRMQDDAAPSGCTTGHIPSTSDMDCRTLFALP